MPSRVCSTLDCQRVHYAQGRCERCYRRFLRKKKAKASAVQESPASYVSGQQDAGNSPNKEVKVAEFPGSAGGSTGVQRQSISAAPLLSAEGVASHLLGFVRVLAGTGTRTAPSVEFGGFRWR